MNARDSARQHLFLSGIGAVAILVICWLGLSRQNSVQLADKLVVGGVLIGIAAFGASLAVRPRWTAGIMKDASHGLEDGQTAIPGRRRVGHHPDCDRFDGHRARLRGRIVCAGCAGMALGAAFSITLAVLYIVLPMKMDLALSVILVHLGIILVGAYFIDVGLHNASGVSRMRASALLPLAFLSVTVGLLESTGNVSYSLIGIVVSVLWLDTRIQVSIRRHERICQDCGEACKSCGI